MSLYKLYFHFTRAVFSLDDNWYGQQYITHTHRRITCAVSAMASSFALILACE